MPAKCARSYECTFVYTCLDVHMTLRQTHAQIHEFVYLQVLIVSLWLVVAKVYVRYLYSIYAAYLPPRCGPW